MNEILGIFIKTICIKFSCQQFMIIQSNTLERSVNRPHESRSLLHFSIIDIKECCSLKPLQNLPWKFENMLSKYELAILGLA